MSRHPEKQGWNLRFQKTQSLLVSTSTGMSLFATIIQCWFSLGKSCISLAALTMPCGFQKKKFMPYRGILHYISFTLLCHDLRLVKSFQFIIFVHSKFMPPLHSCLLSDLYNAMQQVNGSSRYYLDWSTRYVYDIQSTVIIHNNCFLFEIDMANMKLMCFLFVFLWL